jgi:hypothetical protein
MYSDGSNSFVRISDPWDRAVGTPGSPGGYAATHVTGSRYIMKWEDFVAEYESAAMTNGSVNLQIVHADGAGLHVANTGPKVPVGYAQAAPDRTRVRGSRGSVHWDLEQSNAVRRPPSKAAVGPFQATTVTLDDWPYMTEADASESRAKVAILFKYEGGALGGIAITVPQSQASGGRSIHVTANITDGPDTPTSCGQRIDLTYKFTRPGEPDTIADVKVVVKGDGTHERSAAWQAAQRVAA